MSLQDDLARDICDGAAWFTNGDFAKPHEINGVNVLCVIDKNLVGSAIGNGRTEQRPEGIQKGSLLMFIRADELGGMSPKRGSVWTIDGEVYQVADVSDHLGQVYEILFEANQP